MSEVRFSVPNLDCCGEEDDLRALGKVFAMLGHYCQWKSQGMGLRKRGHILEALNCERNADNVYHRLPNWARW